MVSNLKSFYNRVDEMLTPTWLRLSFPVTEYLDFKQYEYEKSLCVIYLNFNIFFLEQFFELNRF